jgi:membrane-associated phospholipid phosphatase
MSLILSRKGWILLMGLALFLFYDRGETQTLFISSDQNTSLAHFPIKILNDFSNILTPDNGFIFLIGGSLTAGEWIAFDASNPWPKPLEQLNIEPVFNIGRFYGEGWVQGVGSLGCWSLGAFTSDLRLQEFGRDTFETLVMDAVVVSALKYPLDRTRPTGGPYSFPSGHTLTAFCVAPVITQYGGLELGIPAYTLGIITGLARVDDHYHYLSDVIAGATLGIILGNSVVYKPKNISVSAVPGGLQATWCFN